MAKLSNLKLICVAATGTNNIDLIAAKQRGIAVTNVAGYAKHSVAQYVFANLLEVLNRTSHYIENTRQGKWQKSDTFCLIDNPINELSGKTLGIVGYGAIAKQVERIAHAFDMNTLIAERPNSDKIRSNRVGFEEMLAASDVISIHCPLDSTNLNLFNEQTIGMMKPGSILINTARGGLVDNQALLDALAQKHLAYGIIDVLDQEPPPPEHPLINSKLDNLLVTAHIAWGSLQAQQKLLKIIAANIESFRLGERLNRVA